LDGYAADGLLLRRVLADDAHAIDIYRLEVR
jgi:hypothetical protein